MLIAACIPTIRPPADLMRLVASFDRLDPVPGATVHIVVIDNRPEAPVAAPHSARWPVTLLHEPERGIPLARNRGLDAAEAMAADWAATLDDDEELDPGWLAGLVAAAAAFPAADAFIGRHRVLHAAEGHRRHLVSHPPVPPRTGDPAAGFTTAVAFIRAGVFRADGRAMRFDPAFRYSGCSDNEFFLRLQRSGGVILRAMEAGAVEYYPESRMGLGFEFRRVMRYANNRARIDEKHLGFARGVAASLGRLGRQTAEAASKLARSALPRHPATPAQRRMRGEGLHALATAAGIASRYLGHRPQPYAPKA
jgi:glycosyltransferase involved in cell wall biosynthesis